MATHIVYNTATVRHDNHTPPASFTQRTFTSPINSILVVNISSTVNSYLSFDGSNSLTLKPGAAFSMDFSRQISYWTKSDSGAGSLEVVTGSEQ